MITFKLDRGSWDNKRQKMYLILYYYLKMLKLPHIYLLNEPISIVWEFVQ